MCKYQYNSINSQGAPKKNRNPCSFFHPFPSLSWSLLSPPHSLKSITMEDGFSVSVFVEYLRSIFHEEIALFLTFSLFVVILGAISMSFIFYFAFVRVTALLGYNMRHIGSSGDLHHLEEAHATRQLKTLSKLPCSQACYCRLLPQQNLPVILAKKGTIPLSQDSEKFGDSPYGMVFTIISSSSSSSFSSGETDSVDHSVTIDGSPAPSYRSKAFSPPGLSPDWTRSTDSNNTSISTTPPSPAPSYLSGREVVNAPPAAYLRRDARRRGMDYSLSAIRV